VEVRDELVQLTRDLRRALGRVSRAGVFAVPGGASPRPDAGASPESPIHQAVAAVARPASGEPLPVIRADLGDCQRCKLATTRQSIVFGVGSPTAPLMFIGEAPGAEEDRRGEPFVGAAGQLLDKMIAAMGWSREAVYIANVLKCRPPGNRDPEPDEVAACSPFLSRQIQAIAPRLIVTLGRPATHAVLSTSAPIGSLRGRWHEHLGIPVMPTFHPAFLLRQPDKKREAWSDLKQVMDALDRLGVVAPAATR
jgi:DNA polymerase